MWLSSVRLLLISVDQNSNGSRCHIWSAWAKAKCWSYRAIKWALDFQTKTGRLYEYHIGFELMQILLKWPQVTCLQGLLPRKVFNLAKNPSQAFQLRRCQRSLGRQDKASRTSKKVTHMKNKKYFRGKEHFMVSSVAYIYEESHKAWKNWVCNHTSAV